MQKRGYFFTLDAFVAVVVLAIGIFLVLSIQTAKPYETQVIFIAQDTISSLSNTYVQEINDPYINSLRSNGTIWNFENSLIEQAGEFYAYGDKAASEEFIKAVMDSLIGAQFGYQVIINNEIIHNESAVPEDTKALSSAHTIIYGIKDNSNMWGPYIAGVVVWQR